MDEARKNYIGGIWDADGTFGIYRRPQRSGWVSFQPAAIITLCDPKAEVIGKIIEELFGFKCVWSSNRYNPKWKTQYRWLLSSQKACDFAEILEPYLIIKKERAQILMAWKKIDRHAPFSERGHLHDEQEKLHKRMKQLNKRGA